MSEPAPDTLIMLESLRQAVANALETKRRLGQYAVVWQDGAPVIIAGDSLSTPEPECGNDRVPE